MGLEEFDHAVGLGGLVGAFDFDADHAALGHFEGEELEDGADVADAIAVGKADRARVAEKLLDDDGGGTAVDALGVGYGCGSCLHGWVNFATRKHNRGGMSRENWEKRE